MKNRNLWIFLAGWILLFPAGCAKELELQPKDALSSEVALSSMKGINAALVGMYASMRSTQYYGRDFLVYGDLSSDDLYLSKTNSNRFLSTYQKNYAAVDGDMLGLWSAIYATVSRANNIINAIDGVAGTEAEKNLAKGQALFIRGLAYFDLVRVFAKPWQQGNGSQLGVPLVLRTDVTATPARNTVSEVYTQITTDLNNAKSLLASTTRADKFIGNKHAASALLSRVYLYRQDYANAITEANAVIAAGYSLTPLSQLADFYTEAGTGEEIFTVKFVSTESAGAANLGNMYLKPGYGDLRVSPDLVQVFDQANDARFRAFISPFTSSPSEFQNNKYRGQDGQQGMYSPKVLRLAEIYLNRAEAFAKSNGATSALNDLNVVRMARGLDALTGLSGAALVQAILAERRKELMFEGHRFFDLMRNDLPVVRTYCNQATQVTTTKCTLEPTDPKAIAPIPQAELDANPGIKGQQNESY